MLILSCSFLLSCCAGCKQNKADYPFNGITIFFSGQSNATNIGIELLPEPDDENVLAWNGIQFGKARNPMPGQMMNRVRSGISLWPALGRRVHQQTRLPVRLIGYANSGQDISHWDTAQEGGRQLKLLFERFCTQKSFFVWYQGESDSTNERKTHYEDRLNIFLNRIREMCPPVSIVVVQLASVDSGYASRLGWDFEYIRQIQAHLTHVGLVESLDLPRQEPDHLSSQSLIALGERIGTYIVNYLGTMGP